MKILAYNYNFRRRQFANTFNIFQSYDWMYYLWILGLGWPVDSRDGWKESRVHICPRPWSACCCVFWRGVLLSKQYPRQWFELAQRGGFPRFLCSAMKEPSLQCSFLWLSRDLLISLPRRLGNPHCITLLHVRVE